MRTSGKTAVVFGYNGNIAKSICKKLADENYNLVVSDLKEEVINQASSEIKDATTLVADVRSQKDVQNVIDVALEKNKNIDAVINCSRIAIFKETVELSIKEWETIIDFNTKSMYYVVKAVLKHMVDNDYGKIIGITSKATKSGPAKLSAYAASMNASIGFLRSLSCEVRYNNIKVNAICPGYVEHEELLLGAELTKNEPPGKDIYIQFSPFVDVTKEPEAIANLVAFIVSDEGDFITGLDYCLWDDDVTYWRNIGVEAEFF